MRRFGFHAGRSMMFFIVLFSLVGQSLAQALFVPGCEMPCCRKVSTSVPACCPDSHAAKLTSVCVCEIETPPPVQPSTSPLLTGETVQIASEFKLESGPPLAPSGAAIEAADSLDLREISCKNHSPREPPCV